jgi:phospholipid/cholesterol/gamma-HCH transport system substrate-binding protein
LDLNNTGVKVKLETRVGIFIISAIAIFFYLSLNIGEFRMDSTMYYQYKCFFDDIGGLATKAPVKIAGVAVGYVEEIKLLEAGKAFVVLRVSKQNKLARNAYAMIAQEGLIGNKSIEIDPGDSSTGQLIPGSVLSMPGKAPTNLGDILEQFRDIASNIQDIVFSMKNVVASRTGEQQIRKTMHNLAEASGKMSDFSEVLDRTMKKNEEQINLLMKHLEKSSDSLQKAIPEVSDEIKMTGASVRSGIDQVSGTFKTIDTSATSFKETFVEAKGVMKKVNDGTGTIGKLVNEQEPYDDLKKTMKGIKNYISRASAMTIQLDMHSETLFRTKNSKGYFEAKIRPLHDYFYLVQLVADDTGRIEKERTFYQRLDKTQKEIPLSEMTTVGKRDYPDILETTKQRKNAILFGFQFGKRFNRMAFRIGLFENTFGAGVDFYVPLNFQYVHWVTSFEAFDLSGYNRLNDSRPHLKWINRAYFMKNVYTTFGIDDFVSKENASPFFGGGIRFSDDDIKYVLSLVPIGKS